METRLEGCGRLRLFADALLADILKLAEPVY
jgi:hypothetical protein